MEPIEKSIELVNRFRRITNENGLRAIKLEYAIQCALIAVDEIIKEMSEYADFFDCTITFDKCDYWNEVKQEIEKL